MKTSVEIQSAPRLARRMRYLCQKAAVFMAATGLLLSLAAAKAGPKNDSSVNIRPIEDFIEAQGKNPSVPPPYNLVTVWLDPATGLIMAVDYDGLVNKWIEEQSGGAVTLGTKVEGTVIERPLPDGRVEVTVLCHARNAHAAVMVWPETDPWVTYLLGPDPYDILEGAQSVVGDAFLQWVFINDGPGAPLPDLAIASFEQPENMIMLFIKASAAGLLTEASGYPEGTPARAQMTVVNLFQTGNEATAALGHIKLHPVGR